jgi:hypothetical protein
MMSSIPPSRPADVGIGGALEDAYLDASFGAAGSQ